MNSHKTKFVFAFWLAAFALGSFCMADEFPVGQGTQAAAPKPAPSYVPGNGVREPVPLVQPPPPYTPEAREARIEGIIVLQAIIRKDGTVDSFKIIRGLGYGLDESAITTIAAKWRFKPGNLNGVPVDVQANIEVRFKMFYSPEAIIIEPRWERSPDGHMNGSGYGNLKEGTYLRGFTYTCSCKGKFEAGTYAARWMEPAASIEINSFDISPAGTKYLQPCELKVTMQNLIYGLKDGALIETPIKVKVIGQEKQ
jgi:TonB family protein